MNRHVKIGIHILNIEGKESGIFFLNWGVDVIRKLPKSTAFFWRKTEILCRVEQLLDQEI